MDQWAAMYFMFAFICNVHASEYFQFCILKFVFGAEDFRAD